MIFVVFLCFWRYMLFFYCPVPQALGEGEEGVVSSYSNAGYVVVTAVVIAAMFLVVSVALRAWLSNLRMNEPGRTGRTGGFSTC